MYPKQLHNLIPNLYLWIEQPLYANINLQSTSTSVRYIRTQSDQPEALIASSQVSWEVKMLLKSGFSSTECQVWAKLSHLNSVLCIHVAM